MYDVTKADHAVNFINCLKHTKGKWRGVPFELLSWQDEIIRTLFGTVKENGYRQYNTCYCEIPKKNGKSELAAAIALYMTCGDGEWGAEVYGCASDRHSRRGSVSAPVHGVPVGCGRVSDHRLSGLCAGRDLHTIR